MPPNSRLADKSARCLAICALAAAMSATETSAPCSATETLASADADRERIRLGVDPEQQLALPDRAIVLHADLEDVAGHLRRDLGQERLDPRLRGVGRVAVRQDVIDEQDQQQPKRDQDDLAHRVGRRRAGADVDFGGYGLGGGCR